jgi:multidrug efflux pump
MLLVTLTTLALTIQLYIVLPKGLIPSGDTGLVIGFAQASPDVSFDSLEDIQKKVTGILDSDPDVGGVAVSIGGASGFGQSNQARFYMSLKPMEERKASVTEVIGRLRKKLAQVKGIEVTMFPGQEIQFGGRQSRAQYQVTLWGPELKDIAEWLPKLQERVKQVPGVVDVNNDRQAGGPQAMVTIDRVKAGKFGISVKDIDAALNDAFSQRAVSTIYSYRNQYNVVLEANLDVQRSLQGLDAVYVKGSKGQAVPLSAVSQISVSSIPLVVNHTGQFPAATISFNTAPNVTLGQVLPQILQISKDVKLPDTLHFELAGETLALQQEQTSEVLLIVSALIAVYLVLGILYEDLVHPLTILSTLPSAGFGALLTMQATSQSLSIISLIGIILLIGIVKKNGIMLVDFALDAERSRGLSSEEAIRQACLERFRPILMTTLAAMFGALPLVFAAGPGSELRTPLGYTIVGGLAVSQLLTIYTTPVIYLWLDRLRRRRGRREPRPGLVVASPS